MRQNVCPNDIVKMLGYGISDSVVEQGPSRGCLTIIAEQESDIVDEDGEKCYFVMEASVEPHWVEVDAPDGSWAELRRIYLYSASVTLETPEESIEMGFDWETLKNSFQIY